MLHAVDQFVAIHERLCQVVLILPYVLNSITVVMLTSMIQVMITVCSLSHDPIAHSPPVVARVYWPRRRLSQVVGNSYAVRQIILARHNGANGCCRTSGAAR